MATMLRTLPGALRGRLAILAAGGALLALLAALAIALARGPAPGGSGGPPDLGSAAAVPLPTLDGGGEARLADWAGGPLFVYFWASWCAPCERETPLIERLWGEYGPRGYTFVGVNIQDREADARAFARRYGLTFPMLVDAGGDLYFELGVHGVPESFFLDAGLRVTHRRAGELEEAEFRAMLEDIGRPS